MNKEYQVKTTITDIEEKLDKNNHRFFKVSIVWELGKTRVFYAFTNDFNLKDDTLKLLTNSPESLINQRVTITYQELLKKIQTLKTIQIYSNSSFLAKFNWSFSQEELETIEDALETIQFLEIFFKDWRIKQQNHEI